eukprot:scaffold45922_cov22-Tisochrysis_lutea.AAC.1
MLQADRLTEWDNAIRAPCQLAVLSSFMLCLGASCSIPHALHHACACSAAGGLYRPKKLAPEDDDSAADRAVRTDKFKVWPTELLRLGLPLPAWSNMQ